MRSVRFSGHLLGYGPGDVADVDETNEEVAALIANGRLTPVDGDEAAPDGSPAPDGGGAAPAPAGASEPASGGETAADDAEASKPASSRRRQ